MNRLADGRFSVDMHRNPQIEGSGQFDQGSEFVGVKSSRADTATRTSPGCSGGMLPVRAGAGPRMRTTSLLYGGAESMMFEVLYDPGISLQIRVISR